MSCDPAFLKHVPLFALLDEDELEVLAGQVDARMFSPRERIYKIGDSSQFAYIKPLMVISSDSLPCWTRRRIRRLPPQRKKAHAWRYRATVWRPC